MKEIKNYNAKKYSTATYFMQEYGIYKLGDKYLTSLSFQLEPDLGEGNTANAISQFPLEDVLDRFCVYVSDFYKELNTVESQTCYLEFASTDLADLLKLRDIIGKHVYNRNYKRGGKSFVELVIE